MVNKNIDERALIEQAKTDSAAFGELYELYVDRIYNYLYYRTLDKEEAEDLTSRVFFRAIQHINHYEDKGVPFSAWLYRIARNMVANWYRDKNRRSIISIDRISRASQDENPEIELVRDQEQAQLLASIRRLPTERQELLILKFVDRLTNAEIGQILGRSEGAIKSLYHRTLSALKDDVALSGKQDDLPSRSSSNQGRQSKLGWLQLRRSEQNVRQENEGVEFKDRER